MIPKDMKSLSEGHGGQDRNQGPAHHTFGYSLFSSPMLPESNFKFRLEDVNIL